MPTTGRNRGESAAIDVTQGYDESGVQHGAPSFEQAPQQAETPAPSGAAEAVEGALGGSTIYEAPVAEERREEERRPVETTPRQEQTSATASVERERAESMPSAAEVANAAMANTQLQRGQQQAASITPVTSGAMRQAPQTAASMIAGEAMAAPPASTLSTQAMNVPAVPSDANLAPSLSSGRVRTAVNEPAQMMAQSAIESVPGGNMLQTMATQAEQDADIVEDETDDVARVEEAEGTKADKIKQEKQQYKEDAAKDAIMEAGEFETPAPMNMLSRANRRFKETRKFIQDKISGQLKAKGRVGRSAFQDTICSMKTVMPDCVSIGSDNLIEAIRDPNNSILRLVNHANPELNLDAQSCLEDISLLVDAINTSNIEVVFSKTPVNTKGSVQVRTLRAHYGRGIALHPTQTKAYNADFDGDTGNLNTDQSNLKNHSRAMTLLIDAEGKPTIDPDFFPLDYLALPSSKDREELIKSMQERNFAWDESIATRIADAYINACNKGDWVGLLRQIDKISGDQEAQARNGLYRSQLSSKILKSLYDYAIDRRGLNLAVEWASVVDTYKRPDIDQNAHFMTMSLVDMVEEIAHGRPAPNFQDFTAFFNKQYGDLSGKAVGGKNVPFRLLADFAKAIHRTDLITVGDPTFGIDAKGNKNDKAEVTMYELWQFTCSAGVSKLISGRMHMGSHELASKTQIKSIVLRILAEKYDGSPVPRWDVNGNVEANRVVFRQWMKDFQKAYNSQMRMWNVAQVKFRGGMGIERGNTGKYDGFESFKDPAFAKAFVEVFGDYSMERVFPDSILSYGRKNADNRENTNAGIIRRYHAMSVSDFAIHNRLDWYSEVVGVNPETKEPIKEAKTTMINKRFDNESFTPMDVIMMVADRRSKQFGDYEKSWMEATEQHVHIMQKISDDIKKDDFNGYAYDMLEFIHLMSPRMFDHFGMDSPITFAKNKWGKKLIDAKTVSDFRSILVSMTVEYRFDRASQLRKKFKELQAEEVHGDDYAQRLDDLDVHFMNEMKSLASSSLAWESIVSESLGRTNAFQTLLKEKKIERRTHEFHLEAKSFWDNTNPNDQYSLINFLKSGAAYETKIAVLCDVIKFNTGIDEGIDVKHVIGMLAHNPDPLFAGSRFEMDSGIRSATDAVKDSVKKISSYRSQTPTEVRNRANKIISEAYKDKVAFEQKLKRFADDPGYYVYVDTVMAADAISSIYEKDYSDSEKIKQQTLVNGYFEAISLQRSGGFYTHLQQTDNAVVNYIGFDQLTNLDIVRILGDPSIVLRGYDEFGVPCEYSRRALCGGDTIDDVLRYLEDHPRIALACRRHMVGINYDPKKPAESSASLKVLDDDKAGDTHSNKVFSLLNDRPRFLAIAALITPTKGDVGRNLAEKVNKNIRNLSLFIMNEAASGKNGNQVRQDIEDFFGVADDDSFEAMILRLRNEGAFDELDFGTDDFIAARNMFSDITDEILSCVDVVRESGMTLVEVPSYEIKRQFIGIDKSSMIAYYDARQQLNGARTAKMIGIEGSETKKNLVLREFVRNRQDRFMTVTRDMDRATILKLSELTQSDLQAELEESDGSIVIEVPQDWTAEDWSLEHNPAKNVGSIAKFLEIKREKGAETFNAKSKKFGDDGSNSIIKFFKYGTRAMLGRYGKLKDKHKPWTIEDGKELIQQIQQCSTKDEAIPILAEALLKADERLGYIDTKDVFQKSDYWNRADLMLVEYDGVVYVRTLEQLAVAFRNRISDEAMLSEDANVVLQELTQLNEVIGTPADPMYHNDVNVMTLDEVRVASGVGDIARIERAIRPYSSSTERNYWEIFKIFGGTRNTYEMPSRKEIEARSNEMFAKLKNAKVRELMKGVAYPHDTLEWENGEQVNKLNPEGSREHIYDYMGRPQDEGFTLIPGPQSLVYFDENSDTSVLKDCKEKGITAAFTDMSVVPDEYVDDTIILEGVVILPFFDMRLNGSVADTIAPAPGQWFFQKNNVIVSDEDTTYEIAPGDASGHATNEGLDKIHFNVDGTEIFDAFDLFPTILRTVKMEDGKPFKNEFSDMPCKISMPDKAEIRRWVLSGEGQVDYGIPEGNPNFAREVKRYYIRLKEYADLFESGMVDDRGMVVEDVDCHYDSIVGFVKIEIGQGDYVFAPIIPFHLEQSSRSFKQKKTTSKKPSKFRVKDFHADPEGPQFNMRWRFTGDVRGQYIKFFEGIGASNKLMIHASERAKSRTLANGLPIDMMYSTKSVASRLFPVNKRIHTMISMLMIPRIDTNYAFNFAEDSAAFPNKEDADLKEGLLNGTLSREDWARAVKDRPNIRYHRDEEINSIVKWLVEKCVHPDTGYQTVSPSIFLATKTTQGIMQPVATEFEAFMDSGYNFQNALMKFMNRMCPTLVPDGIEGNSENTLFKPVKKDSTSDDYGVLQMMVPHYREDGSEYKVAENVYISFGFFGDEFSGFKKVNFDAASRGIDDLNVSANLDGFDLRQVMSFGRAGMSKVPSLGSMEPAQDKIMKEVPEDATEINNPPIGTRIIEGAAWGNVLALTGHRPKDLWGYNDNHPNYKKVADELKRYCEENGVDTIISGMAQGFDQIGAQVAIDLNLNLIAAVPFPSQDSAWPNDSDRRHYRKLLDQADLVVYVSSQNPIGGNKKEGSKEAAQMMDDRNHWMVNNADAVYALYNGKEKGGTANAVKYARMKGKYIEQFNPRDIK